MTENSDSFSLQGQFLIAMPKLSDPNFFKTVTCLTHHTREGALGIIINRVFPSLSIKDIFDELKIECTSRSAAISVHVGGPVHTDQLFVLHDSPFGWESCQRVSQSLGISTSRDILEAIAVEKDPKSFLISLGCAGWGPGQLERELKENSWLTFNITEDMIFNTPIDSRWDEAVRQMGIDPMFLADSAGHA